MSTAATVVSRPLQDIERLITVWLAISLLIIGAGTPDERLVISDIPLSPILFMLAALFSWSLALSRDQIKPLVLMQLPLLPLGFTLLWSLDAEIGAHKFLNLLLVINTAGPLLLYSVKRYGQAEVAKAIIIYLVLLLFGAIVYKAAYGGLLNRYTPYLFNGPIVFARLMSIGLLLALFTLKGTPRVALSAVFFVAIFWTVSKAPIISMMLTLGVFFLIRLTFPQKLLIGLLVALSGVLVFYSLGEDTRELMAQFLTRIDLVKLIGSTDLSRQGDYNTITSRYWLAVHTVDLIGQQPFGVGIGSWAAAVSNNLGLDYPHNLPLEIWAEGGVILGSIALISYASALFAPSNVWKYIALCLLVNQMFSGSLLDSRYIIVALILSFFAGNTERHN